MMPLSSGTALTPSMVNVLPVPVCPYAKIVPVIHSRHQYQYRLFPKYVFTTIYKRIPHYYCLRYTVNKKLVSNPSEHNICICTCISEHVHVY